MVGHQRRHDHIKGWNTVDEWKDLFRQFLLSGHLPNDNKAVKGPPLFFSMLGGVYNSLGLRSVGDREGDAFVGSRRALSARCGMMNWSGDRI